MSELDELLRAFGEAGGDKGALADTSIAHLSVSGSNIRAPEVEGITFAQEEERNQRKVARSVKELNLKPVHSLL
jgi:hypothetical protein